MTTLTKHKFRKQPAEIETPPWCPTCGLTADGGEPLGRFDRDARSEVSQ